jgi:hypothetical protein
MTSPVPAAKAVAGANRIAIASEPNTKNARTAVRRDLTDILYSGALQAG